MLKHLEIPDGDLMAADTETTGLLHWHKDRPFAVSMCNRNGDTGYCEWPVDPYTRRVKPNYRDVRELKLWMGDKTKTKIFQNREFDTRMLRTFGIEVRGVVHELIFVAHICNSQEMTYALKPLADKYLDFSKDDQTALKKAVITCRARGKNLGYTLGEDVAQDYWLLQHFMECVEIPQGLCEMYAIGDVERTMLLWLMYSKIMDRTPGSWASYKREINLWPVTHNMITRGVQLNVSAARVELKKNNLISEQRLKQLRNLYTPDFNPESAPQVRKFLFEYLGIESIRKTKKGGMPSVGAQVLQEYRMKIKEVDLILKCRSALKAASFMRTYLKLMVPDPLNPGGMCIHPGFIQLGPSTSRYACREPNLQNVPDAGTSRSPEPIEGRHCFGPRPDYDWYSYDYAQIEVILFAVFAQEKTMLEAIANGDDIHTACSNRAWGGKDNIQAVRAARRALEFDLGTDFTNDEIRDAIKDTCLGPLKLTNKELEEIYANIYDLPDNVKDKISTTWLAGHNWDIVAAEKSIIKKNSRAKAKMIVFAKCFGGGPNAIKDLIGCTYEEAQEFFNVFDNAFPRLVDAMREMTAQARKDGYITTLYGRRLIVDPRFAYRSINYRVQGSAAGLLKEAMVRVDAFLKTITLRIYLVLTIHDELIYEIHKDDAHPWVLKKIRDIMADTRGIVPCRTPVDVERIETRWDRNVKVNII